MKLLVLLSLMGTMAFLLAPNSVKTGTMEQPVEIGLVHWNRDLADALEKSASTGKPVFVLFQEVPG